MTEYILVASKRPLDLEAVRSRDPASAGSAVYALETGWSARGAYYSTDAVEAVQLLLENIIHPDTEDWAVAQDAVR